MHTHRVFAVHEKKDLKDHLSDIPKFINELRDRASITDAYKLYQKLTHSIKHKFSRGTNNANWSPDVCADDKWIFKQIPENGIFIFEMKTRLGTSDRMEGVSEITRKFLVSIHKQDERTLKAGIWSFYNNERDKPINPNWSDGIDPLVPLTIVKELLSSTRTNCHARIVQRWDDLKY